MTFREATGDSLSAQDVYDIWRIRDAVFAFEQHVEEEDVDGRDLLATTTHLWVGDAQGPCSYLRVIASDGFYKVGRVCTRQDKRGQGLASGLMGEVNKRFGHTTISMSAQSYLEQWYADLGFVRTGDDYDEAGIQHTPMTRSPSPPQDLDAKTPIIPR